MSRLISKYIVWCLNRGKHIDPLKCHHFFMVKMFKILFSILYEIYNTSPPSIVTFLCLKMFLLLLCLLASIFIYLCVYQVLHSGQKKKKPGILKLLPITKYLSSIWASTFFKCLKYMQEWSRYGLHLHRNSIYLSLKHRKFK